MPTLVRHPSSNTAGTTGFTNAGNAYASDDSYATAAPAQSKTVSSYFGGFNFKDTMDEHDTINSVKIAIERKFSTTASIGSSSIRPYDGTTALVAAQTSTAEPASDTVYEVTISPAPTAKVLMSDNFRVLVGAIRGNSTTAVTISLDDVYVTVDYTEKRTYRTATMTGIG